MEGREGRGGEDAKSGGRRLECCHAAGGILAEYNLILRSRGGRGGERKKLPSSLIRT